ncbi:MAG: alanine--tRNA ligase [Candidatus Aenigmarchaeota archaeon]|nr:alanine--tRNA ligase [Candidatus Aenigmarchaeota archaeon]
MNKSIDSKKLKELYLEFFKQKRHAIIPNAPLIPEEDPTVLFTTAGMHPLVRYILGQPHPRGKKLTNVQKCLRTDDIDEVGDNSHLTFFEMLGNWSLGDYWKEDAIKWSWEFLTDKKWLGINKEKLYISVFAGDKDAPRDEESARIWQSLGLPKERIFYFLKKDNWWGPAGATGPCGPDTEMFYDTGKKPHGKDCKPGDSCGKYFEIWNDVFMQYNKTTEGKYEMLKQKNVDTGMGVERTVVALQNKKSVYEIETFQPIVEKIKKIAKIKAPDEKQEKSIRIIADHIRSSTFVLSEEIIPSNVDRGYILRRLMRRAIRHGKLIGIEREFLSDLVKIVIDIYKENYPQLEKKKEFILTELKKEELKFRNTLERGLRRFEEIARQVKKIDGKNAFLLFQSFGFPMEMTKELAKEMNVAVDEKGFEEELKKHQEISRIGAEKKFKGGLSDASEQSTKLHTATHLLNESLRRVLKKKDLVQKGSNITPERLRFDFNFDRPLTQKEISDVEKLVNEQIKKGLSVIREEITFKEAKRRNAQAVFEQRYDEIVSVYSIGDFSIEVCGGPHVKNTKELGEFKIIKEEGIAAGIRRIKAIVK